VSSSAIERILDQHRERDDRQDEHGRVAPEILPAAGARRASRRAVLFPHTVEHEELRMLASLDVEKEGVQQDRGEYEEHLEPGLLRRSDRVGQNEREPGQGEEHGQEGLRALHVVALLAVAHSADQ
jgi:hypothetical protein